MSRSISELRVTLWTVGQVWVRLGRPAWILSGLLWIAEQDPQASVCVYPSDHYYSDESVLAESVERAFGLTRRKQDSVVLVGARPHGPEVEYGWIEKGAQADGKRDSFLVHGFHEKPRKELAQLLLEQGALWNTFVMVGKALAFLELICSAKPGLLNLFRQHSIRRAPGEEVRLDESLYAGLESGDFSREVLSREKGRLIVQRLGEVAWSDLGDCDRAVAALSKGHDEQEWAANWRAIKRPPHAQGRAVVAVA